MSVYALLFTKVSLNLSESGIFGIGKKKLDSTKVILRPN